jgi:predicted NUDIX family NTP pyrophosphohydrolase
MLFFVHPDDPFWAAKDDGAWSLAKGEYAGDEDPLDAAQREFTEETGFVASGDFLPLQTAKQKSGKVIIAWAFRGDFDASQLRSNSFSIEWPPRSGRTQEFPEADRGEWFSLDLANVKLIEAQRVFLTRLRDLV